MATESNGEMNDTRSILLEMVRDAEAITALLITREGICLSEAGDTYGLNITAMAALIAGMFAATKEVASMVGENHFSILLQQGEKRHIHISLIEGKVMMVIIFENHERIGKVRFCARKAANKLTESLSRVSTVPPNAFGDMPVETFKEYALNLVDRIFQDDRK